MEEKAMRMNCLSTIGQEPYFPISSLIFRYIVIRHSPNVPKFNELFYDEGGNLQLWFEELQRQCYFNFEF